MSNSAQDAGDRALVRRWLLCEECLHGELDSILEPTRQDRMVPLLARATLGLSARQRVNLQRQFEEIYQRLAARAAHEGRVLPLTRDDYVAHFLRNQEAVYQSRAVAGLAAVGTPEAKQALQRAADAVTSGALIVRGDVIEELSTALGRPVIPTPVPFPVPVSVPAFTWDTIPGRITAGAFRSCAIRSDGQAFCWGRNDQGQLGDGTGDPRLKPTAVAGHLKFSSIAAGADGFHTCGVAADSVYCWGSNARGELGDGSTTPHGVPKPVSGGIAFIGVSVGGNHACAWTAAHQAYCWGGNHAGQLGDGTTTDRHQPVVSAAGFRVQSIGAGTFHTCADSLNSRVYCWGENGNGQLGDGTNIQRHAPTQVLSPWKFGSYSSGAYHSCGLTGGGSASARGLAYCVGLNEHGRLGDGTSLSRDTLVDVAGGYRFLVISAGERHTCGIVVGSRKVLCWGDNSYGQLGDGTTTSHPVPTKVLGSMSFATVSAGTGHTCGITTQEKAYCWGRNTEGQLGDGTQVNRLIPTKVTAP
jgi:alpha-tubulin suppressor-like RCC1 family protein